jgi:hypothetical protein
VSFYVLQVPEYDDFPGEHPSLTEMPNVKEFMGAFVVDSTIDTMQVTFTHDVIEQARRFETAQLAYAFSQLGGLKHIPTNILRIDGHGGVHAAHKEE